MRRAAAGGALVLGSGIRVAVAQGASAVTLPDADLSYLRLLTAAELLEADFQAQALASGRAGPRASALLRQMAADEKAHYTGLANLMLAAGQTPATADDIDFSYPNGAFASAGAILKQADSLEQLLLGAYMGAVENVQTPQLRLPLAQIGANEAQHAGAIAALAGRSVIGPAFAPSLQMGAVSDALDGFES